MRATLSLLGAICFIALTALTGSSDAVDPRVIQEQLAIPSGELDRFVIGQTLVFHFPRLHAIQVAWVASEDLQFAPNAKVTLHLRASTNDQSDLAFTSIPAQQIHNNAFSKFVFPALVDSKDRAYYFFLSVSRDSITSGSLALWTSAEDAYSDGAMQADGVSIARDLAFRAYYEPDLGMLAGAFVATFTSFGASAYFAIALLLLLSLLVARRSPRSFAVALFVGTLLAFVVAFEQIRDLPAPLWVDSLTHAQYVKLMLDEGRLPGENFYHLGFHVIVALWVKVSGLSIAQSLLLVGQSAWVLSGLGVFVLSRKLSASPIAGLVAAACVWFLSPTPAYFITWGRYPLVLGAAMLPLALLCAIWLMQAPRTRVGIVALVALSFAALAFSQIRLAAFYVSFVAAYRLVLSSSASRSRIQFGSALASARLVAMTGFVLLSQSWRLLCFFAGMILLVLVAWLAVLGLSGVGLRSIVAQNESQPFIDLQTALDVLFTHHGPELYVLAALTTMIGFARRTQVTFIVVSWLLLLCVIALIPPVVGELVPLSLIALMAFLPASLVIGDAAQSVYERFNLPSQSGYLTLWFGMMGCISLIGARDMISVANPATVMFTRSDESAMLWIRSEIPIHSRFLVNSFNWVGSTFLPSDGGGWIRYFSDNTTEYLDSASLKGDSESTLLGWIDSHGINYIYLGTRAGILHASDFLAHPERFSRVYSRDGVAIFQVK